MKDVKLELSIVCQMTVCFELGVDPERSEYRVAGRPCDVLKKKKMQIFEY